MLLTFNATLPMVSVPKKNLSIVKSETNTGVDSNLETVAFPFIPPPSFNVSDCSISVMVSILKLLKFRSTGELNVES